MHNLTFTGHHIHFGNGRTESKVSSRVVTTKTVFVSSFLFNFEDFLKK